MKNTGKFIATVSVNGRAMDSKGNIIQRDPNGLPTMWLNVIAGSIPNRQTLTGSVVQRMGVPMDEDGVIGLGESMGHPFAKRIIYGTWLHSSDHDDYGPQFSWNVIKDMTSSSITEIEEACAHVGEPFVFQVDRPELPADYERKTTQHIGRNKMDERVHGTANQAPSNPVRQAVSEVGTMRSSDSNVNPETTLVGGARSKQPTHTEVINPNVGKTNPDNEDEIIS